MKKLLLIAVLWAAINTWAGAQVTATIKMESTGSGMSDIYGLGGGENNKLLDYAYLECTYNVKSLNDTLDTGGEGNTEEDIMKLLVGPKSSKFYSYKTYLCDSMLRADMVEGRPITMGAGSKYQMGECYVVYKDREKEKLIYTDKIMMERFRYEEELRPQNWEILEETKEILGYECQKAVCDFRGRQYEAWFTWEIPVSEGPWKFTGLPGLIMNVADTEGHYSFQIAGIEKVDDLPVNYADLQYHKTRRKDFLKTMHKYKANPIEYMQNNSGAKVTVSTPDGSPVSLSDINFMKYDFMERDYR